MYYVYLLRSERDSQLYIGFTNDLKRRLKEHNKGESISTRHRAPFKLIYYEAYCDKQDAVSREKQLKRFAQAYTSLRRRLVRSTKSS